MLMVVPHVPIAKTLDFLTYRCAPDAVSYLRMASYIIRISSDAVIKRVVICVGHYGDGVTPLSNSYSRQVVFKCS